MAGKPHRADDPRVSSIPLEERLFGLWTVPPNSRDDPDAAFRDLYDDPVLIKGVSTPVTDLVAMVVTAG
jgi:hypothetical protein